MIFDVLKGDWVILVMQTYTWYLMFYRAYNCQFLVLFSISLFHEFSVKNCTFTLWCVHSMGSPPGLSIAQAERVSGKQPFKSEILAMRKVTFWLLWGDYLQVLVDVFVTLNPRTFVLGKCFYPTIWYWLTKISIEILQTFLY